METIGRFGLRGLGHVRGKFEREIIAANSGLIVVNYLKIYLKAFGDFKNEQQKCMK